MKAVAASTRNTNLSTMVSGSDNSTSAAHSSLNIKVPQGGRLVGLLGVKRDRSDRSEKSTLKIQREVGLDSDNPIVCWGHRGDVGLLPEL